MQENSVDKILDSGKSLDELGKNCKRVMISDSDIKELLSRKAIGKDRYSTSVDLNSTEWIKLFDYAPEENLKRQKKELKVTLLSQMQSLGDIVVLPKTLYYNKDENFIGYTMDKIEGAQTFANYLKTKESSDNPLKKMLTSIKDIPSDNLDLNRKYNAYMELSRNLKKLHEYGIVVSALTNENFYYNNNGVLNTNILVDKSGHIHFCDADSFCIDSRLQANKFSYYMNEHYDALGISDIHYNTPEFDKSTLMLLFAEDICDRKNSLFNMHGGKNYDIVAMRYHDFLAYLKESLGANLPEEAIEDMASCKLPNSTSFYPSDIQDMPKQLVKTRKSK